MKAWWSRKKWDFRRRLVPIFPFAIVEGEKHQLSLHITAEVLLVKLRNECGLDFEICGVFRVAEDRTRCKIKVCVDATGLASRLLSVISGIVSLL